MTREKILKIGLGGALITAIPVIAIVALAVGVRNDDLTSALAAWEVDLFAEASVERADIVDDVVPSAQSLLQEAGFDGSRIVQNLLLTGVPATAFALPNYTPFELAEDQKKQRHCLAQVIYFEARNQPVLGRLAVADVVLNRVADRRFPETICDVVFQGQARSYRCQFSFACDGSMNKAREVEAWDQAEALADIVYRGFRPPLTQFATFYHADYVDPYWAKAFNQTAMIGDHIFYRPPGTIRLAANQLGIDLESIGS